MPSGSKNSKHRKQTASSDNILNFLKKEASEENRRHEEMMTLEQQRLQVEKKESRPKIILKASQNNY